MWFSQTGSKIILNLNVLVCVHRAVAFSLITSGRNTSEKLCHHEARQMTEMMKQEALQLEPVLGSYRDCKFSHTFPMEKPFNYNYLKLPS